MIWGIMKKNRIFHFIIIILLLTGSFSCTTFKVLFTNSNATLTSTIGIVSTGGTSDETITEIPHGTTLAELKAAITPATGAAFEIYQSDGITVATDLKTGYKVIVTASDTITKVTYTITIKINVTGALNFNYTVDINDSANKPLPGTSWSQSMRALALSPDRSLIYTGIILASPTTNRRLLAYNTSDKSLAYSTKYGDAPYYAKSVAVHSSGRVYYAFGDSDQIGVYNYDLSNPINYPVDTAVGIVDTGNNDFDPQGVTVFGNYLYVTSDALVRVYRFNLDPNNGDILSHDSNWAAGTGYVEVKPTGAELVGIEVNPSDGSIWVPNEEEDLVYRIVADGSSFSTVITTPAGSWPHDIAFFGDYALVTFGATDGLGSMPHGVGVYNISDYSYVTTLLDTNSELRNAQGIVADMVNRVIYVVDGYFGALNDFGIETPDSSFSAQALAQRDLIVLLEYIE